ncbi:MAG: translocation/assembly module TamB domain-containing protein [Meiothermus sp.]|uniref:translocation/assembly module TamB domain-containing protein n=1 Tax=Meiothermus sp. TaxID=1955249 RepID=UPI0025D2C124|nr:translocation/assembly module TamB domain-containing protein [Meiothermus sp.]MCS7067614.1 translocation/assembly module TamB domain-containing protein [Meiothermus sp.]MDW8424357.1 translocation/assembly module TamB domain-containing protein [Meiothermus sp.]
MRFWRWLPAILLLLLVGLPAFPPLIDYALREGLKATGFSGRWQAVGGYLLGGLELRGARLEGHGLRLEAQRLRIGYNLLSLQRRELPLRIFAEEGDVFLRWDAIIPEQRQPGAPSPIRLRVDELVLNRVSVQIEQSQKFFLPTLRATVRGSGPYQVSVALPDGKLSGTVWRTGREFEAWKIQARGDLRAARYWFEGFEAGELEGTWTIGPRVKNGILGKNQIRNARVKIVGFSLSDIFGSVDFDGQMVTANLVGRGLEGPLRGSATVDLPNQEYRFRVDGNPTLPALAQTFGLRLPVSGGGPLVLEGRGWQNLVLSGRYRGEGRLLNEPLTYEGTLAFDRKFRLDTVIDGAFFDRTFQATVALRNTDEYAVTLRDSFRSNLRLKGKGSKTQAEGVLVWPRPLLGEAAVRFSSTGPRWGLAVQSENVNLPTARPFSLSGSLQGEGAKVQGRLGALNLAGTWDDLKMQLSGLELVVGQLSGQAGLKAGRFSGDLNYDSPYTRFPIAVRQEGNAWRLSNRYAEGLYRNGVFSLAVRDLPLQILEAFKLSGEVRYAEGKLSGGWNLQSERVAVDGELYDLATRYRGEIRTPLRVLPLSGTADSSGLKARLETLEITADGTNGLSLRGPLSLGPQIRLEANLGLQGSRYRGQVSFASPWLKGVVEGRGATLWASADGYAELSGPVWPTTALKGRLTLPLSGAVEVPSVPLEVSRTEVRWPGGRVELKAGLPFEGSLPLLLNREPGRLQARGNLEQGSMELRTPYGVLNGQGAWRSLAVRGRLSYAGYAGELQGQADLFGLAYQGRLRLPQLEGGLEFRGRSTSLSYSGLFQKGRLTLAGDYRLVAGRPLEGLRLRAIATGYDLRRWGLPGTLTGNWSERGGRLSLETPYGQAQVAGRALLGPVNLEGQSPYGTVRGVVGLETVALQGRVRLPYLSGTVEVAGPWNNLEASGQGRYNLPYLESQPWRLSADVLGQTWKLEGPLELEGKGLSYAGRVNWPYRLLERRGVLQGSLEGEWLAAQGRFRTTFDNLPLTATVEADGASLERLRVELNLPEGRARLEQLQLGFDLETAPLARIFNADAQGRLSGSLNLAGLVRSGGASLLAPEGEAAGQLLVYGQRVEVDYKDRSLAAFLPQYQAGVVLELEPGSDPRLLGVGDLEGLLSLGEQLQGRLSYRLQDVRVEAQIRGPRGRPEFALTAQTPVATVEAQGSYALQQGRGQAQVQLESPYAQASLELSSTASKYQASGRLASLQYLRQNGPVRLSGEGARWTLAWAAPMRVEAQGQAARLEEVRLAGQGSLEVAERRFALSGNLALSGETFTGRMQARGEQVALEMRGEGSSLLAQGTAYEALVEARTNRRGDLSGQVAYSRTLAASTLSARGTLSGTLFKPVLLGEGTLAGRGAEVALRFGYREQLWAEAEGAGLSARLAGALVRLQMDSDLEPFVGLPLRLQAQAEGPWETLRLPLRLSGPNLEATGTAFPARLQAQIGGRYEQQRFDLGYDGQLQLRLDGPYASGTARWAGDAPRGLLQLDLPLPGGRLVGQASLEAGRVELEGREGWQGSLRGQLREGWSQPARWQLEANLQGPLPGLSPAEASRLRLQGRLDLDAAPLALRGSAEVQVPEWGAVQLRAQGSEIDLRGLAELAPLTGSLRLSPLEVNWSYVGPLPRGLGNLEARGTYPGRWMVGKYQIAGQSAQVEGQEARLRLQAPGLEATLTPGGLEARLQNYNLSGLRLNGQVGGPWNGLEGRLEWDALGRRGTLQATWQQNRLQASLEGDLQGTLGYAQTWSGGLRFREGRLELSGAGIPTVEGEVLGLALRLRYPMLQVAPNRESLESPTPASTRRASSLMINLSERSASGELDVRNVEVRGQGPELEAVYPFAGGRLVAGLDLQTFAVRLSAPELGSGELQFRQGQLSGELELSAYGMGLALQGNGARANVRASHPDSPWLPWKNGALTGQLGLDGGWKLTYRDGEEKQQIEAEGRLLDAVLSARGPWLQGQIRYSGQGDWQGNLNINLPLELLASRLQLEIEGKETLTARGSLTGDLGGLAVEASLARDGLRARAGFKELALEEVPLVSSRLPFLTGRATGSLDYSQGQLEFNLSSPGLRVRGDDLALATRAQGSFSNGSLRADLSFERPIGLGSLGENGVLGSNRTTARVRLENGILSGEVAAASFPLHWLFSTWAGDLAGQAFWTGQTTFSLNTRNPWASRGIWVGEYLRFQGGGDTLVGRAALRFEQERLYIDQLALSGKGTWSGSGYYGRQGSNLRLNLENTSFTPVLQVIPNLKPLTPEGSGTLRLASSGQVFDLTLENFNFKLGPMRAETPRAVLRVGETASAEGRIRLTAPYPAEAQLSGEGNLSNFTVRARGAANLPLLSPDEPFVLSFNYPAYTVDANLEKQEARLYGTLFPQLILTLQGAVPVRYPQYFLLEGLLETNLILRYLRGAYIVQGSADVVRARLGFPEGQREVTIAAPPEPGATRAANTVPVEFNNVRLRAERGILIQETLAQGELAGELFLNGDFTNPFLSGEVVPLRGNFKLWDRDFTIRDRSPEERSYARFSPADGILPDLQIVADTLVQDRGQDNRRIQINLTLKGEFVRQNGRIKVNLTPTFVARFNNDTARKNDGQPYTDAEIYALLLLGRSDLSALPADIAQTGLQAAVQNFIVGQLERELAKALGLDQVRVEIPALNGGTIEETRFTIGRYLSPELFFAYTVDLRGYQTIFAEYQQGDYRLRFSSEIFPQPRPELSFGYTIRPIGADLTFDIATGIGDGSRTDGVKFGIGFTFRF